MSKKDPFYQLHPGQENTVNKKFYENFQISYFDYKITLFSNILNNIEKYFEEINGADLKFKKIQFQASKDMDKNSFLDYVKTDLLESYYHCIETFLRIFICHVEFSDSPPMKMVDIESRKIRSRAENFASGNFNGLNQKGYSIDESLSLVFYGCENDEHISKKNLKNIKKWIIEVSKKFLDISEYNAFKHGCYVAIRPQEINIKGVYDIKTDIKIKNDTVQFFESFDDGERYKFAFKVNHIQYDKYILTMIVISQAIKRIIDVARNRYCIRAKQIVFPQDLHIAVYNFDEVMNNLKKGDDSYIMEWQRFPLIYDEQAKK